MLRFSQADLKKRVPSLTQLECQVFALRSGVEDGRSYTYDTLKLMLCLPVEKIQTLEEQAAKKLGRAFIERLMEEN